MIVFGARGYRYLAEEIVAAGGFSLGEVVVSRFPDGERYQRIASEVRGRDAVVVGGTISDEATLEIYDLACGLVDYGARSLTLAVPYFGYSTMDRSVVPGEVVTAKTRARLFSAIPSAAYRNRLLLLDLHSEGLPHYFEGGVRRQHLYAKPLVLEAAKTLAGSRDFVLACTDAGRAKWVESLANDLGVEACFVFKRRLTGAETEVTAVSARVQGRVVIIYDDMIRTGSSVLGAAQAYLDAGATSIAAIATHGLFPGDSLDRLAQSGVISRIVCTNSHPRACELAGDFLEVISIAPLFAEAIEPRADAAGGAT